MSSFSVTSEGNKSFKILIVGNSGVGKTSFIRSCLNQLSHVSTVTTSVQQRQKYDEENQVEIVFVDTPGNSKYINEINRQFKNSQYYQILVYMFSLSNKQSFQNVQSYWFHLCKNLKIKYSILIGHKCDQREIYAQDAIKLAKRIKTSAYYESSTKLTGQNSVQSILKKIINIIKKNDKIFFQSCESQFIHSQLQKKVLNKNEQQKRVEIEQETRTLTFMKQTTQLSESNFSQDIQMQTSKNIKTQSCLKKMKEDLLCLQINAYAKELINMKNPEQKKDYSSIKQSKQMKQSKKQSSIINIEQVIDANNRPKKQQNINKGISCNENCLIM